jgi:transcriptional regulator with XRE-family HTH domain
MYLRRAEDLASLIRERREALNLSQRAFAERLGVSRKWVNEVEQGSSSAKVGLVLRALNELGITLLASDAIPTQPSPSADAIDIDEIADTGLAPEQRRR